MTDLLNVDNFFGSFQASKRTALQFPNRVLVLSSTDKVSIMSLSTGSEPDESFEGCHDFVHNISKEKDLTSLYDDSARKDHLYIAYVGPSTSHIRFVGWGLTQPPV